jgi:O-antigen ligase
MALPRRVLLGGLTALIVARPFVLGEDPGLLDRRLSDSAGMVLSLLWLVLAVGWAVWRFWSKQRTWYASLVDAPLAAVVGIVLASSAWAASYKHPAWLIAWEWLVLLVLFGLVRQLARTPGERRGLLAAVVATGVSLSSQTFYEYAVLKPEDRQRAANPAKLRQEVAKLGIYLEEDDPQLEHWRNRFAAANVSGTFANSNSFASYLALLLPAAVGWGLVSWRRSGTSWWTVALVACALVLAIQLWLTLSRGALFATLLVAALVAVVRGRRLLWAQKGWVLAATAGLAAAAFLVLHSSQGKAGDVKAPAPEAMARRFEYWTASWRMIRAPDRPRNLWLGVGPGNFGEQYRRYMAPTAEETIKDPHNFAIEIWATCGLFALAALLAALLLFFWRTRYAWTEPDPGPEAAEPLGPPRWEFYLGGMAGLTLGFILRVSGFPQDNLSDRILLEGLVSGVGSLLWFAAFALMDNLPWEGTSQVLAMVAGVAAAVLNLCVSGGISFPSVAQPLWTVAALALAARATPWPCRHWFGIVFPLPLLAVLGFIYFSAVYYPVATCGSALADARSAEEYWQKKGERDWLQKLHEAALSPQDKLRATQEATAYVDERIVKPLEQAAKADAEDAYPRLQLAYWRGVEWQMLSQLREFHDNPRSNEAARIQVRTLQRELSKAALSAAEDAFRLDPDGVEGYRMNYQLYSQFADAPDLKGSPEGLRRRRQQAAGAAAAARLLIKHDPTDAEWHYRMADALFQAGDTEAAKAETAETRQLRESDAIRQRSPSAEARLHYRLADELFRAGDKDEALFQVRLGRKIPQREPPDPRLHFRLAQALFDAGDTAEGQLQAREAARADTAVHHATERLTEAQREQLKKWLGHAPAN